MYDLFSNYFEGVTQKQFTQDANEKNWVVCIEQDRELVGFTTILAYETTFEGEPISIVYSGDTIVAPEAWNTSVLPRSWIESVVALRQHYPNGRYYWLLLTSGFRTYRCLPVFWREFYPRFDAPTPIQYQKLIDALAIQQFGSQYDPATGVVKFTNPQRLGNELAAIPPGKSKDPHVNFFTARNPGHANGDELVSIAELTATNLTRPGERMARGTGPW